MFVRSHVKEKIAAARHLFHEHLDAPDDLFPATRTRLQDVINDIRRNPARLRSIDELAREAALSEICAPFLNVLS